MNEHSNPLSVNVKGSERVGDAELEKDVVMVSLETEGCGNG